MNRLVEANNSIQKAKSESYSIASDREGNIYLTGNFQGKITFDKFTLASKRQKNIFLTKLDSNGRVIYAHQFGGIKSECGLNIATNYANNTYLTGYFQDTVNFGNVSLTSKGECDIFVVKLEKYGNVVWAKSFGGTGNDIGYGITSDLVGNIYLTGCFKEQVNFSGITLNSPGKKDIFVVKLNSNGNLVWAKNFGGSGVKNAPSIVTNRSGNIYLTGNFNGTATFDSNTLTSKGEWDVFVAQIKSNGNIIWAKNFGGLKNDICYGIATDKTDSIYLTGYFNNRAYFDGFTLTSKQPNDIFIAKLNSQGNVVWVPNFSGDDFDLGQNIATDDRGNIYITGLFSRVINFGDISLTSYGKRDVFVAKIDKDGEVIWAKNLGGFEDDIGYSIATDNRENVYLTGTFSGLVRFDSTTLISKSKQDIFVAKLDSLGKINWAKNFSGELL